MKMHELKTINPYFTDVWNGMKCFEIRKNDRGFEVGDVLWLREFDPACYMGGDYTRKSVLATVDYMLPENTFAGLSDGYCALGVSVIQRKAEADPRP
jgi:hypothetical protein